MSRVPRMVAPVAAVACVAAAAVVPGQVSAADDTVMGAGRTVLVSTPASTASPGEGDPGESSASSPTISADGSTVAYQATFPPPIYYEPATARISVRDVASGSEQLVGPPSAWSSAPDLDGDAGLVTFLSGQATSGEGGPSAPEDVDVYVQPLPAAGPAERVTGRRTDLHYQRTPPCDPGGGPGSPGCGPRLSDDGRVLAAPATLSLVSPRLRMGVWDVEQSEYLDDQQRALAAVDFGSWFDDDGEGSGGAGRTARTIAVNAFGPDPVRFESVRVLGGGRAFRITPYDGEFPVECAGASIGGPQGPFGCVVVVTFDRSDVCGTRHARLVFDSPTPRGRTEVNLVGEGGDCSGEGEDQRTERRAGPGNCADPADPPPDLSPNPVPADRQTVNFGEVPVGRARYETVRLTNTDPYTTGVVTLDAPGCAVQLVEPPRPPDADPVCEPGMELAWEESCVALVRFAPEAVAAVGANVSLAVGSPTDQVVRFVGAGIRSVVLGWVDRDDDGIFVGAAGAPEPGRRPVVLSVDSSGETVDGRSPSLSADGRYVAFASRLDAVRGTQVLVHDTARAGRPGSTVTASREGPGPTGLHEDAWQPSLSADGLRVAYTTRDGDGEGYDYEVRVRDLAQERTVLVSTPDGVTEAGPSWSPALSADGRAVAFASDSFLLWPDGLELCCTMVYVRDLPDDLVPAETRPDIVSLHPVTGTGLGFADMPAVDRSGGVTVFRSDAALLPDAPVRQDAVYARARFPVLSADPGSVDFGARVVDSEDLLPQTVTVSNAGPGPGAVRTSVAEPFLADDGCDGVTLRRGESCTVTLQFEPVEDGEVRTAMTASGGLTAPAFAEDLSTVTVTLFGLGVPALTSLQPLRLAFPETGLGSTSDSLPLRVTNVLDLPVDVTAAVADDDPHFLLTTPETCAALAPGADCTIEVRFRPLALEERTGAVEVVSTGLGSEHTQDVGLSGTTADPGLSFSPEVAREGKVTFVEGENFAPGIPLTLTWSAGHVAVPTVIPDEDGAFSVPVIVLSGGGTGPRELTVTVPIRDFFLTLFGAGASLEDVDVTAELLVVPGAAQPPGFVARN